MKTLFRDPRQRSRFWFALVGALTCLLAAAALAEPGLTLAEVGRALALSRGRDELPLLYPYRRAAGAAAPTPTRAATSSTPEVARRLAEAGARSGDIQITLSWNSVDDLDLHCYAPNGDHIYYGNRRVGSGGELDVDRNASPPFSREPIENIYWPSGAAPRGRYEVAVRHFRYHGGPTPTPFRVEVLVHGRRHTLTGTVPPRQTVTVHEFTIGRNSGDAGLDERSTSGSTMAGDEAEFVIPVPPPRPQRARYLRAFAVTAAWTGALMALLPLALTLAQCAYLHEPLLSGSRSSPRGGGGIVALARTAGLGLLLGLVAGALAQGVFSLINVPHGGAPPLFSYLIGWTLLGALVGLFSALITPCLPRTAAVLAGSVAGLLAGLLFLPLAGSGDGLAGRIAGATLIGAAIGLMIALLRPDPPVSLDDWLGDDVYDFVPPLVVPQRRGAPVGTLQMPRRPERRGRASSHVRSSDNVNTAEERALRRWRRKNSVAPSSPQTDGRR